MGITVLSGSLCPGFESSLLLGSELLLICAGRAGWEGLVVKKAVMLVRSHGDCNTCDMIPVPESSSCFVSREVGMAVCVPQEFISPQP